MRVRIGGRPLVEVLIERLEACGTFDPIFVAGPRRIYETLGGRARLVDTAATFGGNIRAGVEAVRRTCPGRPAGFITCDVIPTVGDLSSVLDHFRRHGPSDLWFPLARVPEDRSRLGASDWKPVYRLVPTGGRDPVAVLPGHLVIADTDALRLDLMYSLLQAGYRTRNRPIVTRRGAMVRGTLLRLLGIDLRRLTRLRVPNVTVRILRVALPTAIRLGAGTLAQADLEDVLRRIFVRDRHRRRYPDRRVLVPITDALSLALDLDTEEEARQRGAENSFTASA
jgi:hypothetical protein